MGVVIRRYIDILTIIINFPYSTCISSFFGSSIPTSLFIFKCFFGLISIIFLQYIANVTQRTCTRWMRSSHVARARSADCSKNSCQGNNCSEQQWSSHVGDCQTPTLIGRTVSDACRASDTIRDCTVSGCHTWPQYISVEESAENVQHVPWCTF